MNPKIKKAVFIILAIVFAIILRVLITQSEAVMLAPAPAPTPPTPVTLNNKTSKHLRIFVEDDTEINPLYEVYKNGFIVDVPIELQQYIHDMCEEYGFLEKYVYGMILAESTFYPAASNGDCLGLCQINKFWISGANIEHFTDDYADRDLLDPYDNLLTLTEMWCYARDTYNLDLMTEDGMMRVLYWHNSGKDPRKITSSTYADVCFKYADELVLL